MQNRSFVPSVTGLMRVQSPAGPAQFDDIAKGTHGAQHRTAGRVAGFGRGRGASDCRGQQLQNVQVSVRFVKTFGTSHLECQGCSKLASMVFEQQHTLARRP